MAEREGRRATEAAVRREALVDFELARDPDRSNAEIARATGVPANRVAARRRDRDAGPAPGGRNPGAGKAALAELRRDPARNNVEIATVAGVSAHTVRRARARLASGGAA